MKAALFFEDDQLCHLGENMGKKAIKVSTITTEDDKIISIKNSEVKNRNMNYFTQWLVECGIKMIYVSGIDEKVKRFFEQMKIIVNVKNQSDKTLLLQKLLLKSNELDFAVYPGSQPRDNFFTSFEYYCLNLLSPYQRYPLLHIDSIITDSI